MKCWRGPKMINVRYIEGAYLIIVTGTTGAARVKNSVRCKFFQIERKKIHILLFFG